ncbi:peptidoglycan editing factor PgeF [Ampullimonas aquatilis]|uniref:peptidoglycan editing factor PgeF n=1 Tax=Ampullimonas aquatilis TaxID=1341549 RepID=UPI003C768FD6
MSANTPNHAVVDASSGALLSDWIIPDWPVPPHVRALITTRNGGHSVGPFGNLQGVNGMNPAMHFGDNPEHVLRNRALLQTALPAAPQWLKQVHGTAVVSLPDPAVQPVADAALTRQAQVVCAILTADCLPVLLTDRVGSVVACAHAGWRGLAAGVIEHTVQSMGVVNDQVIAYLGPAIGPTAFEVGEEVRQAFIDVNAQAAVAFTSIDGPPGKWYGDLYQLARQRLSSLGVTAIYGGTFCTYSEPQRFYSYRRDKVTGHLASLIWLDQGV